MRYDPMFELKTFARWLAILVSHRAIYAALAACHGAASLTTEKPALYGTMAVLYGMLALKG
jgi:hypothetical protein